MSTKPTTNIERWHYFMEEEVSPKLFIEWGFYTMFSAAMQRRVWLGSEKDRTYGNMINIMVGPPGCGKGRVLSQVFKVIDHERLKKIGSVKFQQKADLATALSDSLSDNFNKKVSHERLKNMLIPLAANTITFEALAETMEACTDKVWREVPQGDKVVKLPEIHSSVYFQLEELASLFRKHHEQITVFFNECYDCKDVYEYSIKGGRGSNYIRKPCINLLAGTTTEFLRRAFSSGVLSEGFSSRAVLIYCAKPRGRRYEIVTRNADQEREFELIVDQIKRVIDLKGPVKFSPEALEFNKHWYEKEYANRRPNMHPGLDDYYARVAITHQKLCMAMHFAERIDDVIQKDTCERALILQKETEKDMHMALSYDDKNPLAKVTKEIQKYIERQDSVPMREIRAVFFEQVIDPSKDFETIIEHLKQTGKIEDVEGKPRIYRKVKE